MSILKQIKPNFTRITLFLLFSVVILLSGFHQDASPVYAQEGGVTLIEGTIPVDVELANKVAVAIEKARTEQHIEADYYAITDIVDEGEWLFVSVAGLTGIPDLETWNVVDHGTWFSFVLVQVRDEVILDAAVYGASGFPALLEKTPDSVVSNRTRQELTQSYSPSVVEETDIFPFAPGYSIHYGFLGVHGGWSMSGVDLGSDGNTALGHAPNQLFASASGTVTYRCTPGGGETTGVIQVGDYLYAHLVDSSINWNISDYVTQGSYLGEMQTGPFSENCGYASQSANWFHVHYGFVDPLTLSGWTLDTTTEIWSNAGDTWESNSWKQIGTRPMVDLTIDSITFTPTTPVYGESFQAAVQVTNLGEDPYSDIWIDLYIDREPTGCVDFGDDALSIESIAGGGTEVVEFTISDLTPDIHELYAFVDTDCKVSEIDESNNGFGPELVYDSLVKPVPIAPTSTITEQSPTYSWGELSNADMYLLVVKKNGTDVVTWVWKSAGDICSGGTCSTTPGKLLGAGDYTWWVLGKNAAGNGPWSLPGNFTLEGRPDRPALYAPEGAIFDQTPTYSWEDVYSAEDYLLVVKKNGTEAVTWLWSAAGDICTAGTCEATPGKYLGAGSYTFWVIALNSYGFGFWSLPENFTIEGTPDQPGLYAPTGTIAESSPEYSWEDVYSAEQYVLVVRDSGSNVEVWETYNAADLCSAGTCTVIPSGVVLPDDSYTWLVLSKNSYGNGFWSSPESFTVAAP